MRKYFDFLFSSWFMGVLFIFFSISMAAATFIENDFGTGAAYELVYDAVWFEALFVLLILNFIGQIFRFRLYRKNKLTILLFHIAFIVIIIGAGLTRFSGIEGNIHLREGETKDCFKTNDRYITLQKTDNDGDTHKIDQEPFTITEITSDNYKKNVKLNEKTYQLKYMGYLSNSQKMIVDDPDGNPMFMITASNENGTRETFIMLPGEIKTLEKLSVGFMQADTHDVQFNYKRDTFYIQSSAKLIRKNRTDSISEKFAPGQESILSPKFSYETKQWKFTIQNMTGSGKIKAVRNPHQNKKLQKEVMAFELSHGDKSHDLYLWMDENGVKPATYKSKGEQLKLTYGTRKIKLPFKLKLNDFVMERYPGSQTPSSYKSKISLSDPQNNFNKTYTVFMNNILKYKGYRFYQSSFDKDEKGSVLSVNYDPAGMIVTYIGYALLVLFIILSLLNKKSLFRQIKPSHWKLPIKKTILIALFLISGTGIIQANQNEWTVDKELADDFGKILVQDNNGRTKPLYTLSNDIIRKVYRKNQYKNLNSMQVFLGFYYDFSSWKNTPLIKISNKKLKEIIGINDDHAAVADLVNLQTNAYKLKDHVKEIYDKPASERNKFDKEVLKVDERLNILSMIISGEMLNIFPGDNNSDKWETPKHASNYAYSKDDSLFLKNVLSNIYSSVSRGNPEQAREHIHSIQQYQRQNASYQLPSETKVKAELLYYKLNVFEKLFPFYATIGLLFIIVLMFNIVNGKNTYSIIIKIFTILLAFGFLFHTAGLVLRWYISGHAPMSNGYESMLFVSWATILAGFLFSRRSKLTLAATSILAALTLLVAHMSFMDPEITNLVPVLKSYWLTLHVSIITASYGFLGMGAILGIFVMILYSVLNQSNYQRIIDTIKNLTTINYKTLTLGLYLLTIGTFLGAIWANESWGRYWGWDPKETWSLISIIVYSFVIHSRNIPGLKTMFAFNTFSLFAVGSILMTYFGVNHYLSGLHSYAGGDPVPVPVFVYLSAGLLIGLAIFAWQNKRRYITYK
ncbi:MAG: c-type cytochrome biogenesis protein CcsB [Bacteroidota bacterium]